MNETSVNESVPDQLASIKRVFELHPELAAVGDEREYQQYLEGVFSDSVYKTIVWHNSDAVFHDEGFKPMKPNFDTVNSIEGIYNFTTNAEFAKRFGQHVYAAVLNIKRPYEDQSSGENTDDMDRPLSEALYKMGKRSGENPLLPKFDQALADADAFINTITGEEYIAKHPVSGREMGIPGQQIVTVFDNEQIHILGSQKDVEGFKRYLEVE